jgi:hypothetical protein
MQISGVAKAPIVAAALGPPVRCPDRMVTPASDAGPRALKKRREAPHPSPCIIVCLLFESCQLHHAVLRNSGFLERSE